LRLVRPDGMAQPLRAPVEAGRNGGGRRPQAALDRCAPRHGPVRLRGPHLGVADGPRWCLPEERAR